MCMVLWSVIGYVWGFCGLNVYGHEPFMNQSKNIPDFPWIGYFKK